MGSGSNPDAKLPYNAVGAIGMSGVTLSPGTAQGSILTYRIGGVVAFIVAVLIVRRLLRGRAITLRMQALKP